MCVYVYTYIPRIHIYIHMYVYVCTSFQIYVEGIHARIWGGAVVYLYWALRVNLSHSGGIVARASITGNINTLSIKCISVHIYS